MASRPLIDRIVCLSELSKDLEGEFRPVEAERERCPALNCVTLETVHQLDLRVVAHACDSEAGQLLDGGLNSAQLVHKYKDGDGNRRGVHEGPFRWRGAGVLAEGTLQGITNAGTHRPPAFGECQRCEDRGVMEGMLLGTILRAKDRRLVGCELRAAYRLRFDPSTEGGLGAVRGSLEGAIVCDCPRQPPRTCIDFGALPAGAGPNPRIEQGLRFTVHDSSGVPAPGTQIGTMGSLFTGLDVGLKTEIILPVPCSVVEATLVTFARPAELEAFETGGASAGKASMTVGQRVAETLRITGTVLDRAVITAGSNETLLLRFCFEPATSR
jgi:hypothetical protein